jgi:hypothetical protein
MNFDYSIFKSKAFWVKAIAIAMAFLTTLANQFPGEQWIAAALSVLAFITSAFLQKGEVLAAAQTSLAAGRLASGQK